MGIRSEDVMPDSEDYVFIGGVRIRKGSMSAILANADILVAKDSTEVEKAGALAMIKEIAQGLVHSSINQHVLWKNPEIQKIFDEAEKNK